ncbi:HesA/MoeB/ThiF family protein [Reinekea sp. G2M2-21]|uniref:HesA/MoeB/ThiF family protein n=1 Tax=Reinekea sp. G2M2-21 TaxID=2788942 RepID=UPI0018A8C1F0|nr:HesA/MoeB/ThiF family protein [Reinekea sp. G2M2-21]
MKPLTDDQLLRYARNILLKPVDIAGQERLLSSHVVVVGAGGLGAPLIQYLAAAGVGTLTIIDDDVVEETNLQRQVIHRLDTVGRLKVDSAAEFITGLNPDVRVQSYAQRLTAENISTLIPRVDLVVIGTDNFASRYLVSDFCAEHKIPLVTGAAIGTSGQVTSFDFKHQASPCFRCLYEDGEDDNLTCATAGVLGPVVGTIGSVMAMEVIKILLSIGQPLFQRLMTWDALSMEWQTFTYQTSQQCPACQKRSL